MEKIARNKPENFSNLNFLLHYHDQHKSYGYYILRGGFTHLDNYFLHETYSSHLIVCIPYFEQRALGWSKIQLHVCQVKDSGVFCVCCCSADS